MFVENNIATGTKSAVNDKVDVIVSMYQNACYCAESASRDVDYWRANPLPEEKKASFDELAAANRDLEMAVRTASTIRSILSLWLSDKIIDVIKAEVIANFAEYDDEAHEG